MERISFSYIFHWYWFLISKRTYDFIYFILVSFIFPILPYSIVAFKLINESPEHKRAFYGDGSLIILCSGILCSFVAMLFEHRTDGEKKINSLINIVLIILFVIINLVFVEAQLTFQRDWDYINKILWFSSFILLFTVIASLYLNFRLKIDYSEVEKFKDEMKRKKIESRASISNKSKGGTQV